MIKVYCKCSRIITENTPVHIHIDWLNGSTNLLLNTSTIFGWRNTNTDLFKEQKYHTSKFNYMITNDSKIIIVPQNICMCSLVIDSISFNGPAQWRNTNINFIAHQIANGTIPRTVTFESPCVCKIIEQRKIVHILNEL